ncbi:hypothetical protein YM304_15690 [Ilumatobacter coccineus YM16-304]|uniref:Uncharacterized protein n=2 Tax=Ilumatobacter coccineus TaxID=467094 RepID=A0A6C7E622_ILUCY|nr:hypothetical protein YM304_15690 [Ilumatobacter coccineus YM16-304]
METMTSLEGSPSADRREPTLGRMSDLLATDSHVDAPVEFPTADAPGPDAPNGETPVAHSAPPAFPPPDPSAEAAARRRTTGLLTLLALAGLAVGVIMTILWLGTKGDVDEAATERDLAVAERDAAVESLDAVQTDLAGTSDTLATTEDELQETLDALRAAEGRIDEAPSATDAEIARLEAQLSELEAAATSAASENLRLKEELDALAVDPAPATPAEFDAAATPGFARWVGELLSSSSGSSRLGQEASTCFGTEIIGLIGVDAIGAGQNNASSGADRQIVIDAMITAAGTCGIDQSLIF